MFVRPILQYQKIFSQKGSVNVQCMLFVVPVGVCMLSKDNLSAVLAARPVGCRQVSAMTSPAILRRRRVISVHPTPPLCAPARQPFSRKRRRQYPRLLAAGADVLRPANNGPCDDYADGGGACRMALRRLCFLL